MIKIVKTKSLSRLKTGKTAIIHNLKGGHGFKSRLSVLGFTPGTEVRMIQNFGHGPIIVEIKDTNIALVLLVYLKHFVKPYVQFSFYEK
ncbi:unnamed protein product [marine sediment metagenome]|uniref:Ferrous iron transporter FeoA-like domain-containing protein n=1 Tax=marine sediment metagenome TaxID=412755 RepID=X1B6Q6_9ZZZZ